MLNIKFKIALAASLSFLPLSALLAIEYTSANTEPQKTGWPVTPTAGYRGKDVGHTRWLDIHAKLVAEVQAHEDSTDILLLGDSITECMGRQRDQWPAVPIPLEKAFLGISRRSTPDSPGIIVTRPVMKYTPRS